MKEANWFEKTKFKYMKKYVLCMFGLGKNQFNFMRVSGFDAAE